MGGVGRMLNPASLLTKCQTSFWKFFIIKESLVTRCKKCVSLECNRLGAHLCDSGPLIQLPFHLLSGNNALYSSWEVQS